MGGYDETPEIMYAKLKVFTLLLYMHKIIQCSISVGLC